MGVACWASTVADIRKSKGYFEIISEEKVLEYIREIIFWGTREGQKNGNIFVIFNANRLR